LNHLKIEKAERLKKLPPYLFAKLDQMREEALNRGMDIIDLGVGDPDLPTPTHIIDVLKTAAEKPVNHRYPSYEGLLTFREAVGSWYKRRFDINLDPKTEILSLIGSKEGIAHVPLAFINFGDKVLIPDPGYPVYRAGTIFAGGNPVVVPLKRENSFLPNLNEIDTEDAEDAKLMFLNYPNNPTAAVADNDFFEEVVHFAKKYNIIVCHDAAYTEMAFDGYRPISFLAVKGARDIGIEFHSLSKTYNMTGWRIGFAVGNKEIISCLGSVKTNIDSGVFQAVQEAGIKALEGDQGIIDDARRVYQKRRDILIDGLKKVGLDVDIPRATFYVWISVPEGYTSSDFTAYLLSRAGIVTTPGVGFGKYGEGYIRMALTVSEERLKEAIKRIKEIGISVE
jgi:LL-diaminopimelate aminotransferase